jgi:hypothetical protein
MELRDLRAIAEAYNGIYAQQKLTEEVEIAAQYFYEMGLNEDGVDILIEELGVDEFAEFVYDISEEYVLTEARAGGVKIEPVTASGKPFKSGKPTGKSLQRLRDKKAARKAGEEKASSEKPSGMKASLQRQSAIASAKKQQPKKKGVLDRIAGAVNKGIERHNAAMSAARETGKTIRKAAGKVGGVAKEVGKGASGAARLAGHVASKGLKEEGNISNNQEAYMEVYEERGTSNIVVKLKSPEEKAKYQADLEKRQKRKSEPSIWDIARKRRKEGRPLKIDIKGIVDAQSKKEQEKRFKKQREERERRERAAEINKEQVDIYDIILSHLLDEGYAETPEAAEAIMVNMSEEWREEIIESRVSELGDRLKDLQQRSATTDVKAQRTAKLARDRFNDLSDKEKEFRKGVEDFARATKD